MTDRLGTPFERKVLRGGFSVRELSDSLASRRFSFLHCADSPLSECTGFPAGVYHIGFGKPDAASRCTLAAMKEYCTAAFRNGIGSSVKTDDTSICIGTLIVFQMLNIIAPQIEDGRVVAFLPRIKVNGIFVTYPI